MNRIVLTAAALIAAVSCSPQTYRLDLQLRQPSPAGIDPSGKSMAIVYLDSGVYRDSLYNNCFADGLAQGLEAEYFGSEKAVEVYDIRTDGTEDYSDAESMRDFIMQTEADIVYLVGLPEFTQDGKCRSTLWVYDSMDKRDTVRAFKSLSRVSQEATENSMFPSDAMYAGLSQAGNFKVSWTGAVFTLLYFDTYESGWLKAIDAIDSQAIPDWATAIREWTAIFDKTGNACRRSCAAYNTAVGCFLEGEPGLASEWLDVSDSLYPISASASLRKRIASAK